MMLMKNRIKKAVLMLLLSAVAFTVQAQSKLHVEQAFTNYGQRKGCKMVTMKDATLHGYKLSVYQSLTYKKLGDEIASLLAADRKNAKKIREVIDDGRIASGYYEMLPTREGLNRFVLYSRRSAQEGTVIYIEGTLTADDIMKMCYVKRK